MAILLSDQSTLTDRYQTTIPASIRRRLNLQARDRIHYQVRDNGEVVLLRAEPEADVDPVISLFLDFLQTDMQQQPQQLQALSAETVAEAQRLTAKIEVDLNEVLPEDDE
jgi:antitoxin PrlF